MLLPREIRSNLRSLLELSLSIKRGASISIDNFIQDPYIHSAVTFSFKDPIKPTNQNSHSLMIKIAEFVISKSEAILHYYANLRGIFIINNKLKSAGQTPKMSTEFSKEIINFLILQIIEVSTATEMLTNQSKDDATVSIIRILEGENFDYSFTTANNKRLFEVNQSDPMIKALISKLETTSILFNLILDFYLKDINLEPEDIDIFDHLQESMKDFYLNSSESYFFTLYKKGKQLTSENKLSEAKKELNVSAYYLQNLIFIRMVSHSKEKTNEFEEVCSLLDMDSELWISSNAAPKIKNTTLFSLLCGIYEALKQKKVIEEDLMTQSTIGISKDIVKGLIGFYPEVLKLISKSDKA